MREVQVAPLGSQPLSLPVAGEQRLPGAVEAAGMAQDTRSTATGFYKGVQVPDFKEARKWKAGMDSMTGTEANEAITNLYASLDKGMTAYLGEPRQANWTTFGKFASRNAGEQIARLEAVERVAKGKSLTALTAIAGEAIRHPIDTFKKFKGLFKTDVPGEGFLAKTRLLRDALVNGNTDIISDIGPAYDTFLRAVSSGQDGLAAMRAAGYGQGKKDPQGFILKAFEKYVEARQVGDELKGFSPEVHEMLAMVRKGQFPNDSEGTKKVDKVMSSPDGQRALKLFERRVELINQGNLLLGVQEQWFSLQTPEVFGDPRVAKMMEDLSKDMALVDANGPQKLLNWTGGNWAAFKTRMGIVEVPPDAKLDEDDFTFELREPDGTRRRYQASTRCLNGDIASYMESGGRNGWQSDRLLDGAPGRISGWFNRERVYGAFVDRLKRLFG